MITTLGAVGRVGKVGTALGTAGVDGGFGMICTVDALDKIEPAASGTASLLRNRSLRLGSR